MQGLLKYYSRCINKTILTKILTLKIWKMKKLVLITLVTLVSFSLKAQILTGSRLEIISTNSHIARFLYNTRTDPNYPGLDIHGSANKINIRTIYNVGSASLSLGTNTVNDALFIAENGNIGIDNNIPAFKFDVLGDINFTGNLLKSGTVLPALNITDENINNWNDAFSWGNHSTFGYINETFLIDSNYLKLDNEASLLLSGGLKDKEGDIGTAGQVLSSTSDGINWIDAGIQGAMANNK